MPHQTSASRNRCLLRAEAYTAELFSKCLCAKYSERKFFLRSKYLTVGINGSVKSMQYSSRKEIPSKVIIPTLLASDSETFSSYGIVENLKERTIFFQNACRLLILIGGIVEVHTVFHLSCSFRKVAVLFLA